MKDLLVPLAVFMSVPGFIGCPVYDDRYVIHIYDGLLVLESFSSARKAMMDGERQIIQYDYVTYIRQS
jgi:hypothetical protein